MKHAAARLAASALLALAAAGASAGPAQDYVRHCMGCHGAVGDTVDEVPRLRDRVGYFTRSAAGRAYLVQVPGVSRAALDDADVAALLNWMLATYSAAQLAPGFAPYTAGEVTQLRRQDIAPAAARVQVVRELVLQGVPAAALQLPPPRLY